MYKQLTKFQEIGKPFYVRFYRPKNIVDDDIILNDDFKKEILSGIIHDIDSKKQLIYTSNIRIDYEFSEKYLEKIGFSWKEIDKEYILKYMDYFKRIGFIKY